MSAEIPQDLLFTKDHEWARVSGTRVVVGITRFAVEQLGDVTQLDLPKEGASIKAGDVFGSVESVKAVSDLYAPLTGKVAKVNATAIEQPELLNTDPYAAGWLIEIELADAAQVAELLSAASYQALLSDSE